MMVSAMAANASSAGRRPKVASRPLGAVAGVLGLATDVVKHVAWYVAHQIDGRPRERS